MLLIHRLSAKFHSNAIKRSMRIAADASTSSKPPDPLSDHEIQSLGDHGFFMRDNWIPALQSNIPIDGNHPLLHHLSQFSLKRAGVSRQAQVVDSIRDDLFCWIPDTTDSSPTALSPILSAFKSLRSDLSQMAYIPLSDDLPEMQYAEYNSHGAKYAQHLDAFAHHSHVPSIISKRCITVILYLNTSWIPAHGGSLRIYPTSSDAIDIQPIWNRLVCFQSEKIPHEVLPSFHPRKALTTWLHYK